MSKIIVCGIPPAQSRKMERAFPGHDLRVMGAQEAPSRYLSRMTGCDLCIINTALMGHSVAGVIRERAGNVVFVSGPSSATKAIQAYLATLD